MKNLLQNQFQAGLKLWQNREIECDMKGKIMTNKFNTNQSIYQAWQTANKDNRDIPAIEYFGNVTTYSQMDQEIDKYTRCFKQLGQETNSSVSFIVPTLPSTLFAFYALNKLGITAGFISKELLIYGGAQHIQDAQAETVIVLDQFYPEVAKSLAETNVKNVIITSLSDNIKTVPSNIPDKLKYALTINGAEQIKATGAIPNKNYYSLQEFLDLNNNNIVEVESVYNDPEHTAVILYTGGSTGVPKGVEKRDKEFIAMANKYNEIPLQVGDRNGVFIPPNHPTAFVHSVVVPSLFGTTQVLQPIYNKATFVDDIYRLKLSVTVAAPSHYATFPLTTLPDNSLKDFAFPFTGGEAVSKELAVEINKTLKRLGVQRPLIVGYGMSEIGPMAMLSVDCKDLNNKVGKTLAGVKARILDKTGKPVAVDERGLLEIFSPDVSMKGYLGQPELTKEFWTEDGYAKTGDIASIDELGNYTVYGRATDIFTDTKGVEHYLFDIENFMYQNPLVAEAEAISLQVSGQDYPVAFVVLKDGVDQSNKSVLQQLYESALSNLTQEEVPAGIMFLEKFGTNPVSTKRDYAALKSIRTGYYGIDEQGVYQIDFPEVGEPVKRSCLD
jgi:long-chain acyl-CoA synthetase